MNGFLYENEYAKGGENCSIEFGEQIAVVHCNNMAIFDTTENFLNPQNRPLQTLNASILNVRISDNIVSYIDPSD